MDRDAAYVLAGFDGSAAGERALRWAVDEARLRRLPLTVCHAYRPDRPGRPCPDSPSGSPAHEAARAEAEDVLDRGMRIAREMSPRTRTRGRLVAGPAPATLIDQCEDASLAVVGTWGGADVPGGPVDSPSACLAAHARCPVVVVRRSHEGGLPVVVGVDGSAASDAALAFGFEEAALRCQPLRAVFGCWEPEAIAAAEMGLIADPDQLREMAAGRLERSVALWRARYPYVDAGTVLSMRTPRHALMEAAAHASLLVLGGRRPTGVATPRLGAVSAALLRHAPCSVAIVRSRG